MARDNVATYDHHCGEQPLLRPGTPLRTGLFMAVNLAGFCVVNAFWQYLATGRWASFTAQAYRRAMVTPLGEMLIHPLNILSHPWMILVTGLVLGVVILVPLAVAVLYRLVLAAIFVVVVAAVGHAPVLALALAAGCVMAAKTPLRSDMPFLATMLGLVPVAVYLYFFAFAGVDAPVALPLQKWVLYAPFVVAALSAVIGSAVVLLLARLTGFRPGAVWPVLAVLLAIPMSVFYTQIGPAELEYSALVYGLAPGDAIFDPVALDVWKRAHRAEGLEGAAMEQRVRQDMQGRCNRLLSKSQTFLDKYPNSKLAPAAQWLKAQTLSLRLDTRALGRDLVKYSAAHYLQQDSAIGSQLAAPAWEQLASRYPGARQAALADWHLGELNVRAGRFRKGYDMLLRSATPLRKMLPSLQSPSAEQERTSIFYAPEPVPDRRHYIQALFEVERLIWLMEQNHIMDDEKVLPKEAQDKVIVTREALRAYLAAYPNDREYLDRLKLTYWETWLGDNLKLESARATPDLNARITILLTLADLREGGMFTDAAIAAKYDLGLLAMRPAEISSLHKDVEAQLRRNSPEEYFRAIVQSGQQPWKRLAEERLITLRQTAMPDDKR
jgi:hypothetical protein